ncbi:peptidylprolyl isomerase [Endozoicomonas sp. OPT23]|uniref:SurA N-terminal domain-containing protein n=1 Tax=Endozoicomonas sp. OPT23 TaxID=2072845 RepID=UPI00129B7EB9|nr:SurA N-terminal domain-containing protein [Endozoicomonas sp. OPT23]MRI34390.1 peptidylprolyl isomerase [Endozoicomonas sp. OPT23]
MLQTMRDSAKSWVTFVIVGIIAFMMAITGLESLSPNPNNPNVATVNGVDITRSELAQTLEQQRRAMIQRMGDQYDPALLDEKLLNEQALQSLIDRTLLLQAAENGGMSVGQKELDAMIISMPQFQQDGRFDQDRFMMTVRSYGMSPQQFRSVLKDETLLGQIQSGVAGSEFMTVEEVRHLTRLENQKRDISWLVLDAAGKRAAVTPTTEEIKAYYDNNNDRFMTDEQVVISYIEMNRAFVAEQVDVEEQDLRDEYQRRIQDLEAKPGKMTVSTILLQTGDKRSKEEAVKLTNDIIAKLNSGTDFAKLAKEYSEDPVTAANGGDMGQVQAGFFGDDFDEAIANLKSGEVSQPVETDFGVQVLKVTSREKTEIPSFDELKEQLLADLKRDEAGTLYLDKTREMADISFEASDLGQPSEQLGLTIQSAGPFSRKGGQDLTADAKVIAAAFSADVLELGANSELVELSPEKALVLRVKEHLKPELKPLEQVQGSIIQALKVEKANEQLQVQSGKLLEELRTGREFKVVADTAGIKLNEAIEATRRQQGVPQQLLATAFKLPHPINNTASFGQAELANGDLAIIALNKVAEGSATDADAERDRMMAMFLANANARNLFTEYLKSIKASADIKIIKKEE